MDACASNVAMRPSTHPVTPLAAIRSFVLIARSLAGEQQKVKPTPEVSLGHGDDEVR